MLSTATKIRIARMLYFLLHAVRLPFGGRDQVRTRRQGINWNLDLREGIDLTIFTMGAFERDTLRALETLVRSGATVLDVGANIGAHTLHLQLFYIVSDDRPDEKQIVAEHDVAVDIAAPY